MALYRDFDFHSHLLVRLMDVPAPLRGAFDGAYGMFRVRHGEGVPDVVIEPAEGRRFPARIFMERKTVDRFFVTRSSTAVLVVFRHRGRPCVVLELGEPVRLFCLENRLPASQWMDAVQTAVQVALWRKGGLFMRGAAVCRDGRCVVLTGGAGAGKTRLLLEMLRTGWDYLSDNTFLLHHGAAHPFRRSVGFNLHHIAQSPWLFPSEIRSLGQGPLPAWRAAVRALAIRHLPHAIAGSEKLKKRLDPYLSADPEALFPGCRVVTSSAPTHWVLLTAGEGPGLFPVRREDLIHRLEAVQTLTYPRFEVVRHELTILGRPLSGNWGRLLEKNVSGSALLATLPLHRLSNGTVSAFVRELTGRVLQKNAVKGAPAR